MIERRIRFYVVHCTAEENERGAYHYEGFAILAEAVKEAKKTKNDFVVVEKHHELREPPPSGFVYRQPEREWEVDHDAGGIEVVEES